jgi:hypothetical protein
VPLNTYFTSVPPKNARRPPARRLLAPLKAFLTYKLPSNARKLCVANASSTRRPLVTNALPTHDRWRQSKSSFCGFAVNASMPGLLARPRGNSNVRLLLPACNTSRNDVLTRCKWRSSVSRRPLCKQRPQPTEKALAQAADERCRHKAATASAELALIKERRCHEALMWAALSAASSLANKQCHHEASKLALALTELVLVDEKRRQEAAKLAAASAELALAKEQRCHEAATQTAMSAESSLANKRCRHEAATQAAELAELVLAEKQRRHKMTAREKALANNACKQRCQELAKCTAVLARSALAVEQTMVLADLALPKPVLVEDKRRQEETTKKLCRSDDERVMAPVLPPDPVNAAIRRIWVECALLAAPLDAILAEIEGNNIAHKAQAPPTTTLPHPVAMLSTPPCPMTYVGTVLSTMGGSNRARSLALAPLAIPSPIVDGQLRTVRQRTRPHCCTGRHHRPRVPISPDEVLPSHPHP